jgi:hypothetical protein
MIHKFNRKLLIGCLSFITLLVLVALSRGDEKENQWKESTALERDNSPHVDKGSVVESPPTETLSYLPGPAESSWLSEFAPLSQKESEEYELVVEQIRAFHTLGRMDQNALQKFRGTVYRLRDRGLAQLGRDLMQVSQGAEIMDMAASEALIDKLDALSYFAKNKDPLAIRIISDLARRPIDWREDGKMKEPLVNTLTLQAFEEFAKYDADAALAYLKNEVKPAYKAPYLYYMKMGFRRAGRSEETIQDFIAAI